MEGQQLSAAVSCYAHWLEKQWAFGAPDWKIKWVRHLLNEAVHALELWEFHEDSHPTKGLPVNGYLL